MKFKSKIYLTYDDVLSMCKQLEYDVSKYRPDVIVGIKRGGLVPALHLSHSLDRPLEVLDWQTRDGQINPSPGIANLLESGYNMVFVDDINDSGRTLSEIEQHYSKYCNDPAKQIFTAVLTEKTTSMFKTNSCALRLDDKRWLVFPWEKD